MNFLIYGGCHSEVIRRALEKYSIGNNVFHKIVNYSLIESGKPFPYETLSSYDFVVFNPIHNKGDWNTSFLEDYCRVNGIKTIKYPWLQWGGYWPYAAQRRWGSAKEWSIPLLNKDSERFSSSSDFYESVFHESKVSDAASSWLDRTTQFLRDAEKRGSVDISIVDWIYDNHKKVRLFQTPDHPCTELYKRVIENIAEIAGINMDKEFYHISSQLQPGVMTPILPNIKDKLNLEFTGCEWRHDEIWGDAELSLRDFVESHHEKTSLVMAKAISKTVRKSTDGKRSIVQIGKKYLLQRTLDKSVPYHDTCQLRSVDGYVEEALLYKSHWKYFEPRH